MKGNYIYIFLLGLHSLGIVYMGHGFFSGGTPFVDNDNEHTASSSLSEDFTVLAAKAVGVGVNISGTTTTVSQEQVR